MPAQLRLGRPDDAAKVRQLVFSTGTDAFVHVFGLGHSPGRAMRFIEAAWRSGRGVYGWRQAFVAPGADGPLGLWLGYPCSEAPRLEREMVALVVRAYPFDWPVVLRRGMHAAKLLEPPRADDGFYLEAMAVGAESRGCGLGQALLDHALAHARGLGLRRCVLHLSQANEGARRFYLRNGFQVAAECRDPAAELRGQIFRRNLMEKVL